jgi:hypothetical protein
LKKGLKTLPLFFKPPTHITFVQVQKALIVKVPAAKLARSLLLLLRVVVIFLALLLGVRCHCAAVADRYLRGKSSVYICGEEK